MFGRMMASMVALTGAAYAQEQAPAAPECTPAPSCSTTALAPDVAGRLTYDTAFFAQFNPQNALDMVNQTPGFSLDGGDDRRGFSGAVGNLLIDGLRPSTKSQDLESILQRIPARQVVRIELLRGADVAGDASGAAVLLNVVRVPSAGSGLWRVGAEVARRTGPQGELSYSGRTGQFEYGAGIEYYSQFRMQPGRRNNYNALGNLTSTVNTPSPRDYRNWTATADAAMPLFGGRLSTNGQYYGERFHQLGAFVFSDPAGNVFRSDLDNSGNSLRRFELGVNYDRDFGPWTMSLIGLANRGTFNFDQSFYSTDGVLSSTFVQAQEQKTGETIVRGTLSRALNAQHRVEVGLESAFNSLDQTLVLTNDSGAGPAALAVPNSNVLVEEERVDGFVVHTWQPSPGWSVETRLAGEQSTLTFTGDSNQTVELAYFKPSVQVSRQFGEHNQLRFRVYRDVDQLDFDDFVSAAGITDNLINGGNPDLTPETSWRAQLAADLRLPGNTAWNVSVERRWIRDVSDLVTLLDTRGTADPSDDRFFDAPGNLGDGDAWYIESNLTLPTPWLLPSSRLTLYSAHWFNEVTDPLTGRQRHFSGDNDLFYRGEFRQDLSGLRMAWGVFFNKGSENQQFRFDEVDTYEEGPWVDAFVETTAIEGLRIRLTAANILDGDIRRQRMFFGDGDPTTPDNRNSPFLRLDERHREFDYDPWFVISVSGSF
ncbi:hypothetical protein U91I_03819 [alpha proteobacterium U9-1i]|nr:hypothetical protein U91I_03819 [alpha proteobacterium U9-1i]